MGLGRREARHLTVAAARVTSVNTEDYWDFKPGQKVMTADGFAGVVASVDDGPIAGVETYNVTLDNNMGGGQYTASLLRAMPRSTANVDVKTAADDYPELGTILEDRPPLAMSVASSLHEAKDTQADADRDAAACDTCNGSGEIPDDDAAGDKSNDDPDYPNKACPDCDGLGHKTASSTMKTEVGTYADAKKCPVCSSTKRITTDTNNQKTCGDCGNHWKVRAQDYGHTAAFNEGDPDKYTSEHSCPKCHSPRALESATGMIKCEDCGYEQDSPQDGYSKSAGFKNDLNGWLDMHVRAPAAKPPVDMPSVSFRTCKCPDCKSDRQAQQNATSHNPTQPDPSCNCPECRFGRLNLQHANNYGHTASVKITDEWDMLTVAAVDSEFRFHVTASYSDVRRKAKRLRAEGAVNIISVGSGQGTIVANVKGDTAVYETEIVRMGSNAIAQWHCGCKWGSYTWGRSPAFKRFEGRLCSHALALHFEAQSQGMFGRSIQEEKVTPDWLRPRTRVVTDFNKDDRKNVSRPAVPRKRDMRSYATVTSEVSPVEVLISTAQSEGVEMEEILVSLASAGIDGRPFFTLAEIKTDPEAPGSHHKDRSGDLAPCSRGGCGHPEGLHGEDDGHCQSEGCDCGHFQRAGTGTQASLNVDAKGKAKHHKKQHHVVHHVHHHHQPSGYSTHPHAGGWGGYGYGFPMVGLGGNCSYCNGDGGSGGSDGGGDSGGDGGGGDGGGATASLRTTADAEAGMDTMDPTYTPGNDVRSWGGEHGIWQATSPPDLSANPGSTGWASGADPAEFSQDSSAFGRTGSLWPVVSFDIGHGVKEIGKAFGDATVDTLKHPFHIPDAPGGAPKFIAPVERGMTRGLNAVAPWLVGGPELKGGKAVVKGVEEAVTHAAPLLHGAEQAGGAALHGVEDAGKGLKNLFTRTPKPGSPIEAVPMKPGSGAPIKAEPVGKPQTAPETAGGKPGSKGKAKNEGEGGSKPPKEEKPSKAGEGKMKGKTPVRMPRLPGFSWPGSPDYNRVSEMLKGMLPTGHASLQIAALLAEEEALLASEASYVEAEKHDEPEPALPSTDGADDDLEATAGLDSDESVDDIVSQFQATAGAAALAGGGSAGGESSENDVAAAAKAFLQTTAMKTFTPSEQKQIIDEGMDVTASNLDRLDIKDTHYEALEAALASQTDDDDLEF